jgi:Arc/MetJ-type ribon-helix-helix transcriptional regulator
MSAEPVPAGGLDDLVRDAHSLIRALDDHKPAELSALLSSPGLSDLTRQAVAALAVLQAAGHPPAELLSQGPVFPDRDAEGDGPGFAAGDLGLDGRHVGAARKVSISMPEDLTAAVQRRVGRGKFSQYVSAAVSRQFELDLLADLSDALAAEHGPVPEEDLAAARAAWPDDE